MQRITHYCDQCGTEKKDANNWRAIRMTVKGYLYPILEIRSFEDAGVDWEHICGSVCLGLKIAKYEETLRKQAAEMKEMEKKVAAEE